MNLLRYLFRQSRPLVFITLVTSMLGGLSSAALMGVIGRSIGGTAAASTLAWQFFGLCAAYMVLKYCSEVALLHMTQTATCRLRTMLSRKVLATSQEKLDAIGKAGVLVILTRDIDIFVQFYQNLPLVCGDAVIVVACIAYMAWLSWQICAAFAVFLVVGLAAYHFAERAPLAQLAKTRERIDAIYQHFRGLIHGSKELQLNTNRGEMFISQVMEPDLQYYRRMFTKSMVGYAMIVNVGAIQFYLVIGLLLFVVPQWCPQNGGTLLTVTLILLYLIRPITMIATALPMLRHASIALKKIEQLDTSLAAPEPQRGGVDPFATAAAAAPLSLELRDVVHHYAGPTDDSRFQLGPIDLTVRQGEILFIVGGNGSGKTTLGLVMLGLYEPESGTIALNGVAVNAANRTQYRQYFSAVLSDFHVFEQLLGDDRQTLSERATYYIDVLAMSHKVKIIDGKFSTVDLSSGQRKRLALVWSYLEDRPIYLFDEWAADQDPAFKRVFYTELLPELKARGKTVLIITHDDAYFSYADRIVRLEDGRLRQIDVPRRVEPAVPAVAHSLSMGDA
jgi:putative pyoverdin transport system ATP-binding/permease protein